MFFGAVDFDPTEQRHFRLEVVARPHVADSIDHFQIGCARFLLAKLVARETQNSQIVGELFL